MFFDDTTGKDQSVGPDGIFGLPSLWPVRKTSPRVPFWVEMPPGSPQELLQVIAMEVWERSEGPRWHATLTEADLARFKSSNHWHAFLVTESLTNELQLARNDQAVRVGFALAQIRTGDNAPADLEELCRAVMKKAGIEELSEIERVRYERRAHQANDGLHGYARMNG